MSDANRYVFVCGMSRSGTTLLATILDAHPDISMGYELLPANLPPLRTFVELLERAAAEGADGPRPTGNRLKGWGHAPAGVFVKRAARALVEPEELRQLLLRLEEGGTTKLDDAQARTVLSMAVVHHKMEKEGTTIGGYKIGTDLAGAYLRDYTSAVVLFIMRDPRDVVASHRANEFPQDLPGIARTWVRFAEGAGSFVERSPGRCALVRYEDLVESPEPTLRAMCEAVDLAFAPEMLQFFGSKASVFTPGQRHVNAENLARDFFTTSVDRWREDLEEQDVIAIERLCRSKMDRLGYACMHAPRRRPLGEHLRALGHRLRNAGP